MDYTYLGDGSKVVTYIEYDIAYGNEGATDGNWSRSRDFIDNELEWILGEIQKGNPDFDPENYPEPIRVVKRTVTATYGPVQEIW